MKKITLTIGIPAYNEGANIGDLLRSVLKQKGKSFIINKILVVLDGCEDDSESIVKGIKDRKIHIIKHKKRFGQNYCQNLIFKDSRSDAVVLFEADTMSRSEHYLEALVSMFVSNKSLGIVQGNEKPVKSTTFVGKVLECQFNIYQRQLFENNKLVHNFSSGRGGRLFSKEVVTSLRWPIHVPDDVYAMVWAKTNCYSTAFAKKAVRFYKEPQNHDDYKKVFGKVRAGKQSIEAYFSNEYVDQSYNLPFSFRLRCAVIFFITNPVYFFYYLVSSRIYKFKIDSFHDMLPVSLSTKIL